MADCQFCIHDYARAEGYPGGCPFFGTAKAWNPGRPKAPDILDVSRLADRQLARAREVWKLEQAAKEADERERRDRQLAVIKALLREVAGKHDSEVSAQNAADMAKVRELAAGARLAEQHEQWTRIRQMIEKLGRTAR